MAWFSSLCALACLLLATGCGSGSKPRVTKMPSFSILAEVVGGERREVIEVTNGLSLYFTDSKLVAWFGKNSYIIVDYDAASESAITVMLKQPQKGERPAQTVWDVNADGIPEIRSVEGQAQKQIFYRGEWFTKVPSGSNTVISLDGHDVGVHFDGLRWVTLEAAPSAK